MIGLERRRGVAVRRYLSVTAVLVGMIGTVLPASAASTETSLFDAFAEEVGADTPWRHLLQSEIEPDPTCDDSTPLRLWIASQLAPISPATMEVLQTYAVFDWAFFWTIGGDQDPSDEFFGADAEYTRELLRRHRDNVRFWNVPLDDVWLQGTHGGVIADDSKMVPLIAFVLQVDLATAQTIVDLVQTTIEQDPAIDFDHPIFTFNALAFPGDDIPGFGVIPPKVAMGDGILEGFEAIGFDDVASDFIHAHEVAHQVQYKLGVFDGQVPAPEATRRTELMADGLGAYHVAHVRGTTFQTKRLIDTIATVFNVGDCAFEDVNHHGTPEQRAAAGSWGVDLATSTLPRAHVVPSQQLVDLFDDALPDIVGG
jgi:hypothetical protein